MKLPAGQTGRTLSQRMLVVVMLVSTVTGCRQMRPEPSLEPATHPSQLTESVSPGVPPAASHLPPFTAQQTSEPARRNATGAIRQVSMETLDQAVVTSRRQPTPVLQPELLPPISAQLPASLELPQSGPRTVSQVLNPEPLERLDEPPVQELNLTSALALAGGQNPQIAFAAARYREAYERLLQAKVLWLPSLRAGLSYNHHEGTIQETSGRVFDVSRSSMVSGLGVQAIGAGTMMVPGVAMNFHAADAIFEPQAAGHLASARQAATRTATNDTLLATAIAYLQMLRAVQELRIAEVTRDHAQELTKLTTSFAQSGQGSQSDADRAQTELVRRRNDVTRSQEAVTVTSARLAELLRLDPSVPILPQEPTIVPIDLVSLELPLNELLATGLANRPELAEVQHLVCEAVYRYRREKFAPFVPSVLLGISDSGFGGGRGSQLENYQGRFDFDVAAYWEVRNLGFGEQARRGTTRAQYEQTRFLEVQTMDRVAREVVEAHAQVQSRRGQISVAETGIQSATDAYQRDVSRIREGQGLPIEALQSLQALDQASREYLRTLVDYNDAQFRLQRALGWQVQ